MITWFTQKVKGNYIKYLIFLIESVGDISVVDFSGIAGTKVTCEVRANQIYGVERIINCEVLSAPALVVRTVQIPKVEGC